MSRAVDGARGWILPILFVGSVLVLAIPDWQEPVLGGLRLLAVSLLALMLLKKVREGRHRDDAAA